MFKFSVVYLLLLILIAIMGGLQIHDPQTYPHAALGQAVLLFVFWLIGCGIAAAYTRTPKRAARTAKDEAEATREG